MWPIQIYKHVYKEGVECWPCMICFQLVLKKDLSGSCHLFTQCNLTPLACAFNAYLYAYWSQEALQERTAHILFLKNVKWNTTPSGCQRILTELSISLWPATSHLCGTCVVCCCYLSLLEVIVMVLSNVEPGCVQESVCTGLHGVRVTAMLHCNGQHGSLQLSMVWPLFYRNVVLLHNIKYTGSAGC